MKKAYPYVGEHTSGLRVKFTAPYTGAVVRPTRHHPLGETSSMWVEGGFAEIKHEENVMQKLKKGDIIIGSQMKSTNVFSVRPDPKVHTNVILANQEVERLAKEHPEKKFVALQVMGVGSVPTPGIIWE